MGYEFALTCSVGSRSSSLRHTLIALSVWVCLPGSTCHRDRLAKVDTCKQIPASRQAGRLTKMPAVQPPPTIARTPPAQLVRHWRPASPTKNRRKSLLGRRVVGNKGPYPSETHPCPSVSGTCGQPPHLSHKPAHTTPPLITSLIFLNAICKW